MFLSLHWVKSHTFTYWIRHDQYTTTSFIFNCLHTNPFIRKFLPENIKSYFGFACLTGILSNLVDGSRDSLAAPRNFLFNFKPFRKIASFPLGNLTPLVSWIARQRFGKRKPGYPLDRVRLRSSRASRTSQEQRGVLESSFTHTSIALLSL